MSGLACPARPGATCRDGDAATADSGALLVE
jgi:hypothetical protein